MNLEVLTGILVQFLRDNISDPLGEGRTWVYPDYPRIDTTMPRISLINTGGTPTEIGIGDVGQRYDYTFDLDIWVKKGNVMTENNTKYAGSRLRERLTDKVINTFMNNRVTLSNQGIKDIRVTTPISHPYDDELGLYRKTLTLIITVERLKE